jgi:hypothetical protein
MSGKTTQFVGANVAQFSNALHSITSMVIHVPVNVLQLPALPITYKVKRVVAALKNAPL